ncbi:thioredoxin-dependent thiol peroxidase [Buchnera aphidicola (Brevicoryne brassicae)]|uniref:thioredoxin-dependent thiol peroxidase n=1 Tax=Buchnera aphidicola TaxID=9 RepID=UPI0010C593CE|nr:thioredoxin-dependent thiol peroxidase [Buchnera aphidicola]QCI19679.1 thioredoxin-dependent thiol peroxidase [Buchnera aphidicola (Brevicoryne brassicae)]
MNILKSGTIAPQFILPNHNKKLIQLSDFLGRKVLLYFYPKAMTSGCIIQACNIRDNIEFFKSKNIEILAISPDPIDKLLSFRNKKMLNFNLLSDQEYLVSKKFGIWGEKYFMGKQYYGLHRTSFLINVVGIIEKVFFKFQCHKHHSIVINYLNDII